MIKCLWPALWPHQRLQTLVKPTPIVAGEKFRILFFIDDMTNKEPLFILRMVYLNKCTYKLPLMRYIPRFRSTFYGHDFIIDADLADIQTLYLVHVFL